MTRGRIVLAACVLGTRLAGAQTFAVDVSQSVGASSEALSGAATQVRLQSEPAPRLRLELEGSWGDRTSAVSDALGTAYPYGGRADVVEAFGDYRPGGWVRSIRAGRFRTPFGFSAASDHAYIGFLRPPLIRYGGYFALSNGYLEHGVDITMGAPRLWVEATVGRPADIGVALRRPGTDAAVRVQGAAGPFIVGASYLDTTPYQPVRFAAGRARFGGADVRWMHAGVQVRGEVLAGQPFDGTTTTGGYVDLIVHRPVLGPFTPLLRAEWLDYDAAPPRALRSQRLTAAGRVRVWRGLTGSIGVTRQSGKLTQSRRLVFDAGLSLVIRATR